MSNTNLIVTAPVLIPFTPDCEYQYGEDVLPPSKIEHLANSFNKYQIIDLQHEFTKRLINKQPLIPRGKLLKSYISTEKLYLKGLDGVVRVYPKGTWIIIVEIVDDETAKLYENGVLTGLSVTVKEKEHADAIIDYLNNHNVKYLPEHIIDVEKGFYKKPKRILMKDVENPVAFTVSLVRSPCVYDAKMCKNSCVLVNKDKLKENKILNLKEKIKNEINSFIDGLDVDEESVKEDINTTETESDKEEVAQSPTDTPAESESIKEDDGDDGDKGGEGGSETPAGGDTSTTGGSETPTSGETPSSGGSETPAGSQTGSDDSSTETPSDGDKTDSSDSGKGNSKGKVKKEAKKEDISSESEKSCDKTIYGRKIKTSEAKKESTTDSESDKEVLYLAQDDVENLISTTLRKYAEEVEQMVFDGIQDALDDYLFSQDVSYKEDLPEDNEKDNDEKDEEEEVEAQKEYATPEMVQSMFDEQFASFKSSIMEGIKEDLMGNIKKAQKESIKSYSKAIAPSNDGLNNNTVEKSAPVSRKIERDFNGCRIRKR